MNSYRFVIRSYPTSVRQELGDEIIETANLLAPTGWSARQSASLLTGGLRSRATASTGRSAKETWAIGIRTALLIHFIIGSAGLIAFQLGVRGDISSISPSPGPLSVACLAVLVVLVCTTRWPAAVALTAFSSWVASQTLADPLTPSWAFAPSVVFAVLTIGAGWWVAIAGDGRRVASPAVATMFFSGSVAVAFLTNDPDIAVMYLGLPIMLLAAGLLLVSIDPRPSVVLGSLAALTILPQLPPGAGETSLAEAVTPLAIPVIAVGLLLALGFRSTALQSRTS